MEVLTSEFRQIMMSLNIYVELELELELYRQ